MTTVKKLLILTLTVLFTLMPLAGCGSAPAGGDAPVDYEDIYAPILEKMYNLIMTDNADIMDIDFDDGTIGVWETVNWADTKEDGLSNVGYTIEDLNGDGVEELVISSTWVGTESEDGWTVKSSDILALYTVKDGEPYFVFEGWGRNGYNMMGDGRIYNWGSNGAAYSIFSVNHLSDDCTELIVDDYYFTYDDPDGEEYDLKFYHNTTGEWGEEGMDEEIDEDTYWELQQEYTSDLHEFEVITFLRYAQDSGLPTRGEDSDDSGDVSDEECAVRADWGYEVLADLGGNYYEYSFGDSANADIVFGPAGSESVKNFSVLSLTLQDVDDAGVPTYDIEEVYTLDKLTAEKPLLVYFDFIGDIPNNGIKYCDENGVCHYFTVSESGYDGSVVLAPFMP